VFLTFAILLFVYHLIFGQFFPTNNGTMGHDWSWQIPGFLKGYAGFVKSGDPIFSLGLFLPGFGSGADATVCHASAGYGFSFPYDVIGLLIGFLIRFGLNPITIVYVNFLLFAAIGFWGMFILLRSAFGLTLPLAILGAGMFMFNGFYAHRIVIGHPYHGVMLLPLLAYCLFAVPHKTSGSQFPHHLFWGLLAAVTAVYALNYGVQVIIVGFLLTMVALVAIWFFRGGPISVVLIRSVIALVCAAGIVFPTLYSFKSPAMSVAIAQRVSYSFPAFRDIRDTLGVLAEMLFISPVNIEQTYLSSVVNLGIAQQRHELEYGVTVVPLLILLTAFAVGFVRWLHTESWDLLTLSRRQWLAISIIFLVMLFPLIYTTNFPSLLPLIKKIPLINATTSPQRTFLLYVVLIPMLAVFALRYLLNERLIKLVAPVALAIVVAQTAWKDREFYHAQQYDPAPIQSAHREIKSGGKPLPPIEIIGLLTDKEGNLIHDQMVEANLFLLGVQHLGCYIPGYSSVPVELIGNLHPGSIWDEKDGYLNIKNPACNSWPAENNCQFGGHFTVAQKDWVKRYIKGEPFPMQVPKEVRFAANVSAVSIFAVLFLLSGFASHKLYRCIKLRKSCRA
jgi:hypothetical protein